jgi:hypothetical protein
MGGKWGPIFHPEKKGWLETGPKTLIHSDSRERGRKKGEKERKGKKRRQGRRRRELEKNHTRRHGFRFLHILSTLLFSLFLQPAHL